MKPGPTLSWAAVVTGALLLCAEPRASKSAAKSESELTVEDTEVESEPSRGDQEAPTRTGDLEAPFFAQDCAVVFGDAESRLENRSLRRSAHLAIEQGEYDISVSYSTDWTAPMPIDLDQLELVETMSDDEEEGSALVYLDSSFDAQGCDEGYYLLPPDGVIGDDTRVLAVLDDVILLERDGELRYLRVAGAELPEWRMLWHSPWVIVEPPDYGKAKRSPAHKRRAAAKHKPKPRRGRKR